MIDTGILTTVPRPSRRRMPLSTGGWIVGGLLLAIAVVAVLAPLIAPYDPSKPTDAGDLQPFSSQHPLGTDSFSRDTLSRLIYGAQVSMTVGLATTALVFVAGFALGVLAAYAGKWGDALIGRLADTLLSIPGILLAITLLAILGPSMTSLIAALALVYLPEMIRVVRGSALSARSRLHVRAAVSLGASPVRVMLRHIAPFVIGPATVQATFVFAYAILSEAALSFLGVGVQPPAASWGNMISDGLKYLSVAPLQIIIPSAAITLVVLLANLLGDALRDVFDPEGAGR